MREATIVGSGPNGLAAAVRMAQAGVKTTVYESLPTIGGACSTGEVTLPGFHHDLGASAFPLGVASPFFNSLPLARHGLRWIEPPAAAAHPLDGPPGEAGTAVMLEHSLKDTCSNLDRADRMAYQQLLQPLIGQKEWPALLRDILGPILHVPRNPVLLARFGLYGLLPATTLGNSAFKGVRAKALFAGMAAHSVLPLTSWTTSAVALVLLAAGHNTGWPVAEGGAGAITAALAGLLRELGGEIVTSHRIDRLPQGVTLCDTSTATLLSIAGDRLDTGYRRQLAAFQPGPGSFKVDYALSEAIPWRARECSRAGTVHLGGTMEELTASEAAPWNGSTSARPYCLVVQPSLFDPSRAPRERHTAWVYCHVPFGSAADQLDAIEAQMERFAPGFRECVLARRVWAPAALGEWNANLTGGDLSGGAMKPWQLLARPTLAAYTTPAKGVYLCSSSTPPGGGVHGMCGFHAAERALKYIDRG